MHPHDIIFVLKDTQRLVINLEDPFELMPCYCLTKISFYDDATEYVLDVYAELGDSMRNFVSNLTKALCNDLQLHQSITKDIGILSNEYAKSVGTRSSNLVYEEGEFDYLWVGGRYQLWECGELDTWMYNDNTGAIIFKITPLYPGFFTDKSELAGVPSHKNWLQTYQPVVTSVISPAVAQQWLEQATKILAHIDERFAANSAKEKDNDKKMIYEDCPRN